MAITLDKQVVSQQCPSCGVSFPVVRGSVYEDGSGMGLYLIALHGHSPRGRVGHLAVAVVDPQGDHLPPLAAAMDVLSSPDQFGFALVEWADSPWQGEAYLGRMLAPDQVRASRHRPTLFRIADRVVEDLPEVQAYFA